MYRTFGAEAFRLVNFEDCTFQHHLRRYIFKVKFIDTKSETSLPKSQVEVIVILHGSLGTYTGFGFLFRRRRSFLHVDVVVLDAKVELFFSAIKQIEQASAVSAGESVPLQKSTSTQGRVYFEHKLSSKVSRLGGTFYIPGLFTTRSTSLIKARFRRSRI